jgi:hypothetical protein
MNRLTRATTAAVLLAACLLAGAPARAQKAGAIDDARRKAFLEGTQALRRILFTREMKPLAGFRDLGESPSKSIVIILGDTGAVRRLPGGLGRFLERGGAVLVASDRGVADWLVRWEFDRVAGVGLSSDTVVCTDLNSCYHRLEYCPWVEPVPDAEPALFRSPENNAREPLRVATNMPSELRVRRDDLRPGVRRLAFLPASCRYDKPGRRHDPRMVVEHPLFMVGGEVGAGRLLVLADHSVFINEMMLRPDNGNIEFADNCLAYLRGDGRDRVLFVEEGQVRTDFDVPMMKLKVPPGEVAKALFERRDWLVAQANRMIANFEDENDLSRMTIGAAERNGVPARDLGTWLLLALTVLLLAYLGYRLGTRGRQQPEPAAPPLQAALARSVPASALTEQRHQAQLRAANLWEPARELARRWWAARGLIADGPQPTVAARGGWWQGWRRRRLVAWLWRLASGERPCRVSLVAFRRLQADLAGLSAALANGAVVIRRGPGEGAVA